VTSTDSLSFQRGITQGKKELLYRQLTHRLGELPEVGKRDLEQLNDEELNKLSVCLFGFLTTHDLQHLMWKLGYAEGLKLAKIEILSRVLTRRLGDLPSSVSEGFEKLSDSDLENLSDCLLDFTTLDDLEKWITGPKQ
jgi:hypothetical protein